jgi:hypothetical protein
MDKDVKLWVICKTGAWLSGHGHKRSGEYFLLPSGYADTLANAAPEVFSLKKPRGSTEAEETKGGGE